MEHIKINNLKKSFNKKIILKNINLKIKKGELFVILGPSGSGKTTLLRIISGLEKQDKGDIFFNDKNFNNVKPKDRDISMVFQNFSLYPNMNVYNNLAFPLKVKKTEKEIIDEKINKISKILQIEHLLKRMPNNLSGGEKQRIAIGRALVKNSSLFLFDEPFSNLDTKLRLFMRNKIKKIHNEFKKTIIFVTHNQKEAMNLADRICILDKGLIQQIGTPMDIYKKPKNKEIAKFIGDIEINMFNKNNSKEICNKLDINKEFNFIGIRPENIIINNNGKFKGKVLLIDEMGDHKIIHLKFIDEEIRIKTNNEQKIYKDKIIYFDLNEDSILFF